jgi:hypothetical protein
VRDLVEATIGDVSAADASNNEGKQSREDRPRVSVRIEEGDQRWQSLLAAIGRAVMCAALLESSLQVEVARLAWEVKQDSDSDSRVHRMNIAELGGMTAGQLLGELRTFGLSTEIEARIADAIARRNRLVHHPFEEQDLGDPSGSPGYEHAVERIDRLARDCASLAAELHIFALRKLGETTGRTREDIVAEILNADLSLVADPRERASLERRQATGDPLGPVFFSDLAASHFRGDSQ